LRVAIAGFQHETNTFSSTRAELSDFEQADAWPGLTRGAALVDTVAGANLPVAGFLEAAHTLGIEAVPLLWCAASPSGKVTRDAFETIAGELLQRMSEARAVEAIYLDLHGAMVCEHVRDGEGELLRRVRDLVGPDLPVVVSLDFHANISAGMYRHASAMVVYRTYPHVDMAATGQRAARLLRRITDHGPLRGAMAHSPFLIPLTWQCTLAGPMAELIADAMALESRGVASVSLAGGFPAADVRCCGPTIVVYAETGRDAKRAAASLLESLRSREGDFAGRLYQPPEAVERALVLSRLDRGPVVLADTQDNPGAGGSSDTTGLLRALVAAHAPGAVLGLLHDPEAARAAHAAGLGGELTLALGGRGKVVGDEPFPCAARVLALGNGRFEASGPFYAGCHFDLGPMALLEIAGVRVVVSHRRQQAADQAMFRHLGVEPATAKILALKSSVHFRADFESMAAEVLIVVSPGSNPVDPATQAFQNLRPGLRLRPLGPAFQVPRGTDE
jgi:microcystin degradation protein MlrC